MATNNSLFDANPFESLETHLKNLGLLEWAGFHMRSQATAIGLNLEETASWLFVREMKCVRSCGRAHFTLNISTESEIWCVGHEAESGAACELVGSVQCNEKYIITALPELGFEIVVISEFTGGKLEHLSAGDQIQIVMDSFAPNVVYNTTRHMAENPYSFKMFRELIGDFVSAISHRQWKNSKSGQNTMAALIRQAPSEPN